MFLSLLWLVPALIGTLRRYGYETLPEGPFLGDRFWVVVGGVAALVTLDLTWRWLLGARRADQAVPGTTPARLVLLLTVAAPIFAGAMWLWLRHATSFPNLPLLGFWFWPVSALILAVLIPDQIWRGYVAPRRN